jgi:hypothetical protein
MFSGHTAERTLFRVRSADPGSDWPGMMPATGRRPTMRQTTGAQLAQGDSSIRSPSPSGQALAITMLRRPWRSWVRQGIRHVIHGGCLLHEQRLTRTLSAVLLGSVPERLALDSLRPVNAAAVRNRLGSG